MVARRRSIRAWVAGWVRNEPDGSVRCVAEGEAAELDRFVQWPDGTNMVNGDWMVGKIADTNLMANRPSTSLSQYRTPVKGLYLTDSCQLHPDDRTVSNSIGLGKRVAQLVRDSKRAGG